MKIKYFLFGEVANRRYHNFQDLNSFLIACNGNLEGSVFKYNPHDPKALNDLMEAFNGWFDYIEINKQWYDALNNNKQLNR